MVTVKRERFIVFKIISEDGRSIPLSRFRHTLWVKFQSLYGLESTTKSAMYFIDYNESVNIGLIRCSHTELDNILTSMALLSNIDNIRAIVIPVFISGLLNKAKKHYNILIDSNC